MLCMISVLLHFIETCFMASYVIYPGSPGGSVVNHLPMQEMWFWFLGLEDPLEEEIETHSSILARKIPMDRGVQLATVHKVAQSRTHLKWLSTQKWLGTNYLCLIDFYYHYCNKRMIMCHFWELSCFLCGLFMM